MIAVCFYSPEVYKKLLEISDDRDKMCDTYDEWLVEFMKMKKGFEEKNVYVSPLLIEINDLIKYCKENNLKNTGPTRSRYVSKLAMELDDIASKGIR